LTPLREAASGAPAMNDSMVLGLVGRVIVIQSHSTIVLI
jgi:hypothetical protein